MKTKIFIFLILFTVAVGAISFTILLTRSEVVKKRYPISTLFSKSATYKSDNKNTDTQIELNYKDSTYTYAEKSVMKPGADVSYTYHSKGRFKIDNNTLTFYSEMPSNAFLSKTTLNLTDEEIRKNKFSYIYPIDEALDQNHIKIYFDNIAEINDYEAYTIINDQLKPLKIIERKILEEPKSIATKNDNFTLFHHLTVEKPANRQLLIVSSNNTPTSQSFLFDLTKIPYQSFHFFTRAYGSYYDFTGLKFKITENYLQKISEPGDRRYSDDEVLNSTFSR